LVDSRRLAFPSGMPGIPQNVKSARAIGTSDDGLTDANKDISQLNR
jgi:hypothetical protein